MRFVLFSLTICAVVYMSESQGADTEELNLFYRCENYQIVNMEKLSTGHDVISAELNGVSAKFVLDTGAKFSVIDKALLGKYNIDPHASLNEETGAGAAGEFIVKRYALSAMQIAGHKLEISLIGATDLSQVITGLGRSTGVWVDGIIGQDLLLPYAGIINNPERNLYLQLSSPSHMRCNNKVNYQNRLTSLGYQAIPLRLLNMDLAAIEVAINGNHGTFILDSGAGAVIVDDNNLAMFQLNDHDVISAQSSSGAGGDIRLKVMAVESINIQGSTYNLESIRSLDLSAVVTEVKTHSATDAHGVIGQDLLQRHQSIISFYDNTLYLKP